MKRYLCLICLLGSLIFSCMGQNRSQWIQSPPRKAEMHYYRMSSGVGLMEEAALKKALALAIVESSFAIEVSVDINQLKKWMGTT